MSVRLLHRRERWTVWAAAIVTVVPAGVALAPTAVADSAANLRNAVATARGGTSCGPFRPDPILDRVAEVINRSTDDYTNHNAAQVPIDDPIPGLKALGYGGNKAAVLRGAGKTEADAIRGALTEGSAVIHGAAAISDCSYKDFGASVQYNEMKGYYLTSSVLAGA